MQDIYVPGYVLANFHFPKRGCLLNISFDVWEQYLDAMGANVRPMLLRDMARGDGESLLNTLRHLVDKCIDDGKYANAVIGPFRTSFSLPCHQVVLVHAALPVSEDGIRLPQAKLLIGSLEPFSCTLIASTIFTNT